MIGVEGFRSPSLEHHGRPTPFSGALATSETPQSATKPLPLEAHRYQFFQAVRLLEAGLPGGTSLGTRGPASQERIRLRPSTSLGFPASDIAEAQWTTSGKDGSRRAELTTNFLGLVGVTTPMPLTYAQEVLREEEDNPHLRAFLDLFHHRLLSLLYRAWLRRRYELAFQPGGEDSLSRAILAMMGIAPETSAKQLGIPPERLLRYAGLLVGPCRSAERLEALLGRELNLPVRVEPFSMRWASLSTAQRAPVGASSDSGCRLGKNAVVGARLPDRTGQLKLLFGPLTCDQADSLLPGRPLHTRLLGLTRFFVPFPMSLLLALSVPVHELRRSRLTGRSTRLGSFSHLGTPRGETLILTLEVPPTALASDSRETSNHAMAPGFMPKEEPR